MKKNMSFKLSESDFKYLKLYLTLNDLTFQKYVDGLVQKDLAILKAKLNTDTKDINSLVEELLNN